MNKEPLWYAVYTRPRWEKKVADLLARKGVEQYCPLNRVVKQWSDRKKTVHEPLFKSYVFIRIREEELLTVKQTDGIINLVYWLGKPAVIRESEIEAIRHFMQDYENVQLEKATVNVNDKVRIVHGPLMEREGSVVEVMNNTVKVMLPSLGYALVAQVSKQHIEKVKVLGDGTYFAAS